MTNQKSSKLKYSLVTIFSIFLLYSFSKNSNNSLKEIQNSIQINQSKNKIRSLLDKDKVDKVCERASKEVQEFFSEEKENEEKDYEKDSESVKQLMNIIDGKGDEPKNESIKKYIFRVLPVAFFIVFGVISIILWPTCICCMCCCKCCCCICCCKSCMKLFQLIIFFVSGGAFAVTFIFSTYGIAATDSVFKGVDSTLCTIFKVINEAVEGQSKTTLPKWAGIEGVKNILSGIAETIDDSQDEIDSTFSTAMIRVEQSEEDWENKMTSAEGVTFEPFSLSTSETPKTKNSPTTGKSYDNVIPDYAFNYGNYLDSIQTEFTGVTDAIFTSLKNAKNDINSAFKDASFKSSLDDASGSITKLQGSFDDLSEKIAKPLLDNEELISKQIKQYAQIVFGIIMGLCAGMTGIYVIQYINCCSPLQSLLKIVTFVVWNLLFLFSIVSFIVSGFIGLIGIVGKDGTALASYLISEENLESKEPRILGSSDSNKYLKVCIHGDGNLKEQLQIGDSMDQLDDLYNLQNDINTHKTTLSTHSSSLVIQQFNEKNYQKNFLDCNYFNDGDRSVRYNFNEWLDELNLYTQISTNSYQNHYDERWDKVTSYQGYTYLSYSTNIETAVPNSKKLLSIYEDWDKETQVKNRYPSGTSLSAPYSSVAIGASTLYDALKTLLKGNVNTKYYQKINNQNTILNNQFEETTTAMKTALDSASKIITRLTTLLSEYIGEEGTIYSLINCAFIGKDFNFLMKQLHDSLGNNVYNFASVMITMTCFLTLALYASVLFSVATKKSQESSEK